MEQIKIEAMSFSYPQSGKKAVDSLSLSVSSGEFVLLCGKSGCGKTTLLRQLKKELAPHGKKTGSILINGKNTDDLSLRESAETVGFVMQEPDLQIVTDKVWHEMAFGLENLGLPSGEIRLRTAETASYFGIDKWFNKSTAELSGGQKQLLNLAAVMVMQPDILLLDEPTSQLDPIAAENFLFAVNKLNRELGTTVILIEQRLEEAFAYADRVIVMDNGKAVFDGSAHEAGGALDRLPAFMRSAAPAAARIFNRAGGTGECPVTVREGRSFLLGTEHEEEFRCDDETEWNGCAVSLKDVCFRYEKNGSDVLRNFTLNIPERCFFAVLGGNGTGKTTLLKLISSAVVPYSGKIRLFGEKPGRKGAVTAVLPQDVRALFTSSDVFSDLKEVCADEDRINRTAELLKISGLLDRHPFDLSGGEMQRAAFAKVLLCAPRILLLDEPTKGMDAEVKEEFASLIREQVREGRTVVMISHDAEFCAKYADMCAMIFDGCVASSAPARRFFSRNRFYTTAANRMARGIIKNAVTDDDICRCLKEKSCR